MDRPTLREGDLVLRPATPADADAITAACQDPEIPRWTNVPSPYTRDDAERFVAYSADAAAAGREIHLLVVGDDGTLLGCVGMTGLDGPRVEVGYWVAAEARGRGIAPRAVELLLEWARREHGVTRVDLCAHPENAPSQRVARKAGFRTTGERRAGPRGESLLVLRRD
jgi:RimJ/RimL family protein N-acetyltransferase